MAQFGRAMKSAVAYSHYILLGVSTAGIVLLDVPAGSAKAFKQWYVMNT